MFMTFIVVERKTECGSGRERSKRRRKENGGEKPVVLYNTDGKHDEFLNL